MRLALPASLLGGCELEDVVDVVSAWTFAENGGAAEKALNALVEGGLQPVTSGEEHDLAVEIVDLATGALGEVLPRGSFERGTFRRWVGRRAATPNGLAEVDVGRDVKVVTGRRENGPRFRDEGVGESLRASGSPSRTLTAFRML